MPSRLISRNVPGLATAALSLISAAVTVRLCDRRIAAADAEAGRLAAEAKAEAARIANEAGRIYDAGFKDAVKHMLLSPSRSDSVA